MKKLKRIFLVCTISSLVGAVAYGQPNTSVKIGILTDMTGFLSDALGQGSVDAARMAIEDFGGEVLGQKIELVAADHQNKPDVGLTVARKWFDVDGVDVIADIGNSAVGMGVRNLSIDRKKLVFYAGASSSGFTNEACSPYGTQWSHDTYMFGTVVPSQLTRDGLTDWYFITADFTFGHALEKDARAAIEREGGKIAGSVKHPSNIADFSSFLLQAASSKAEAVALANALTDTSNGVKQWNEFNVGSSGKKLVALTLLLTDVRAIGLDLAQGTTFSTVFYWDLDDKTRAFSKRFYERNGFMPAEAHAGTYSAVNHYLRAVAAAGTKDADVVATKMKEMPIVDFYSDNLKIRDDGRVMRDSFIATVKSPEQSSGEWDLYNIVDRVDAEHTWRPLSDSDCDLVTDGSAS